MRRGPAPHRGAGGRNAPRPDLSRENAQHRSRRACLHCRDTTLRLRAHRIEPFAGHIQLEAEAHRHFKPVSDKVVNQLPPDSRFQLEIPAVAMLGLNDRAARPIQDALARWILATAPSLPIAAPGRYVLPIQKVTPPGVPFAVTLHRWPREKFRVPFVIQHIVEGDVEARRLSRINEALQQKVAEAPSVEKGGSPDSPQHP
jgi:hypothetical protein